MIRDRDRAAFGILGAASVAIAARRLRALTTGGALAATVVGASVVAGAGMRGGAALVAFFLSSTLLGRLPAGTAAAQRRGNERDAVQVCANGGVAALLALASLAATGRARTILLAGCGGAVATAAADTWATEIGSRSGQTPRSVATLAHVPPGTSGGVTLAGLVASAAGAATTAFVLAGSAPSSRSLRAIAVAAGGVIGSLGDSMLGATVQEVRVCDNCALETELLVHACGAATRPIRGAAWCSNDMVNALATATGAAAAMAIVATLGARRDEASVGQ
jgi:uncharacterized protein (TIGR00297 family)